MPHFLKPNYETNGFANIPSTVVHLLTGQGTAKIALEARFDKRYDNVILFLVDAFGWRFFEKYVESYPFLKRFVQEGAALKLTSQFPSTTAAHITTLHTGLAVGESGVHEWQYYEPALDAIIMPLMFSFVGTRERETLKRVKADPKVIYPYPTLYDTLNAHHVSSYLFQHRDYTPSTYSDAIFRGATEVWRFDTWSEALTHVNLRLAQNAAPAYYYSYFSNLDSIAHQYGPDSPYMEAEIDTCLTTMERLFYQRWRGHLPNTLLLVTADHGVMAVDPATTLYLNTHPRFAGYEKFLKTDRAGNFLAPAGSPRDFFLYIKEELLDEAQRFFAERLLGQAEVRQTQDLIAEGYFGLTVSERFLTRAGNLVILAYPNQTVWWYEKDKFEMKFYGHHGGLTKEEMEIPLLMLEL